MFELADRQQQNAANPRHETFHTPKSGASSKTDKKDKSLKTNPSTETHSNSEVSPKDATSAAKYSEQVSLLQEMFPGVVEETLLAVLMRCQGDMEVTIQKLLTTSGEDVGGRQLLEVKKAKDKVRHRNMLTVEPPNKGHFGANSFVPCREVVPISEVK